MTNCDTYVLNLLLNLKNMDVVSIQSGLYMYRSYDWYRIIDVWVGSIAALTFQNRKGNVFDS